MPLVETVLDLLHVVRQIRAEREVYREIAHCAIHRLHQQHLQSIRQRNSIRRLRGEVQSLRRGLKRQTSHADVRLQNTVSMPVDTRHRN